MVEGENEGGWLLLLFSGLSTDKAGLGLWHRCPKDVMESQVHLGAVFPALCPSHSEASKQLLWF